MTNLFTYIKDIFNSKKNSLYSHYEELSTDNIKQKYCAVYRINCFNNLVGQKKQINFDDFMKSSTNYNYDYNRCGCSIPHNDYSNNYEPNTNVFLEACTFSHIEKNECIEMFDFNKIKDIDIRNAQKLTLTCDEKCTTLTNTRQIFDKKSYDEKINESYKQTMRTQIEK